MTAASHIGLDEIFKNDGVQGVIIHSEYQILAAALLKDASPRCHDKICRWIDIDTKPNNPVLSGAKASTNRDTSQYGETGLSALKCANYVFFLRYQKPNVSANRLMNGRCDIVVTAVAPERVLASIFFHFTGIYSCMPVFWSHISQFHLLDINQLIR